MNKIKIIQGRNANANMSKLVTSGPPSKLAHLVFIFCIYFLLKMPIFPLHLKLITTGCISMLQTHSYLPLCMIQSVSNTCINELLFTSVCYSVLNMSINALLFTTVCYNVLKTSINALHVRELVTQHHL